MQIQQIKLAIFLLALSLLSSCSSQHSPLTSGINAPNAEAIVGGELSFDPRVQQSTVFIENIFSDGKDSTYDDRCTGVIISTDIILTAAHCFFGGSNSPLKTRVVFSADLKTFEADNVFEIPQEDITLHPEYLKSPRLNGHHDMAVITLGKELPKDYHPAPLLIDSNLFPPGTKVLSAGYGLEGDVDPILGVVTSATQYRATHLKQRLSIIEDSYSNNKMLRVRGERTEFLSGGDSGGPLYVDLDGVLHLIGTTKSGVPGHYSFHARVDYNWEFIKVFLSHK